VALNCAALPETLLESELFGHEKGAFTGAMAAHPGRIEQAAGGVLFLDEVAEMSPAVQAKLLRVLQEREYQRLGGTRPLKTNVRILAATNRDLEEALARGQFREDLYYRLRVFEIRLPPLRERTEDILPLAEAFLEEIGPAVGRPAAGISRQAHEALHTYHWPGNVRELRNVLERASILCDGGLITVEHLPAGLGSGAASGARHLSGGVVRQAGAQPSSGAAAAAAAVPPFQSSPAAPGGDDPAADGAAFPPGGVNLEIGAAGGAQQSLAGRPPARHLALPAVLQDPEARPRAAAGRRRRPARRRRSSGPLIRSPRARHSRYRRAAP
jgi:DNA-binding NtrC family response regulator